MRCLVARTAGFVAGPVGAGGKGIDVEAAVEKPWYQLTGAASRAAVGGNVIAEAAFK